MREEVGQMDEVGRGAGADGAGKRIDIISDTHGLLSDSLLAQLEGADLIIHAGDITSDADYLHLRSLAPLRAVLGNNDWPGEYGPEVGRSARFSYEGLDFAVSHYREMLPVDDVDVAVCGHTHVARVERLGRCTVVNPGSASYPRGRRGATIARMRVVAGRILSLEIVDL